MNKSYLLDKAKQNIASSFKDWDDRPSYSTEIACSKLNTACRQILYYWITYYTPNVCTSNTFIEMLEIVPDHFKDLKLFRVFTDNKEDIESWAYTTFSEKVVINHDKYSVVYHTIRDYIEHEQALR